jgi:O-antigen/teichoic acid export membrane protein
MSLLDSLHIDPHKFRNWVRNVASSYMDIAISGATFFFLTPYIVRHVGLQAYAVWIVCQTIAFYLRFYDLGFGQAQIRYQARFHARGRILLGRQLLSTTSSALAIAGVLACASGLALSAGVHIPGVDIAPDLRHDFTHVLLLVAATLLIAIPGTALSNVYYGTQRFDLANIRSIGLQLLSASLQFVALHLGHGIVALAAIQLGISLLRVLIDLLVIRSLYPELLSDFQPGFHKVIWRRVRRFAIWSSLDDLLVEGTSQLDRVFIAVFLPLSMLAPYALCKSAGSIVSMIIEPMTQTFYPMAAGLYAQGKRQALNHLLLAGTKTATAIALPIALFLALFGEDGLVLWVPEIAPVVPRMLIAFIALNLLLSVFVWTSTIVLLATNRVRTVAIVTIGEILLAFGFIAILTRYFGLTGIAMGSLAANLTMAATIQIPLICRVMKLSANAFLLSTIGRVGLSAVPAIGFALWLRESTSARTWITLLWIAGAIGLVFLISFIAVGITPLERKQYFTIIRDYIRGTPATASLLLPDSSPQ